MVALNEKLHHSGTPPATSHVVNVATGINPKNANEAVKEATDMNKLLNDIQSFMQQLKNIIPPPNKPCNGPRDAVLGQQA